MQRTLKTRFRACVAGPIFEIGFGQATRGGRADPRRPWSACVYVHRKQLPRDPRKRIPRQVAIRLRRGRRFVTLHLATDVIELAGPALSGRQLRYRDQPAATAGAVLVWRAARQTALSWGLLTVGHAIPRTASTPQTMAQVTIKGNAGTTVRGRLLAKTPRHRVDGALVAVSKFDLIAAGIIDADQGTSPLPVLSLTELKNCSGHDGNSFPAATLRPFQVRAYMPECSLFRDQIGVIHDAIHVYRARAGTFARGSSGSSWAVANLAAIQFGGVGPAFSEGLGQALVNLLDWAATAIDEAGGLQPGSLRVVARI
jgi:hypothetical protein